MRRYLVVFVGLVLVFVGLSVNKQYETTFNDYDNVLNHIFSPIQNFEFASDSSIEFDLEESMELTRTFAHSWMDLMFSVRNGIACLFSGIGLITFATFKYFRDFSNDVTSFFT